MFNKREYSFDILRVISMFMVVVIHVSNVYSRNYGTISNLSYLFSLIFNTICRISVPIFLMISGALLLDKKYNKVKFKKRISKYIMLIAAWDVIYLIWEFFYLGITYNNIYILLIKPLRAHLWFLYTILVLYLAQPLAKKILEKASKNMKITLFIGWIFIAICSYINSFFASIISIFIYLGYFILGKYLYNFIQNTINKNNKRRFIKKINILGTILIIICFCISIILNYYFSLKYNMFYNAFFAYRSPFIMISSILFFIIVVLNLSNVKENKLIILLSNISLGVYLIHGIFLDIVKTFFNNNLNSSIGIPIYSIIIFICSVVSVYYLSKFKTLKKILQ